MFARIARFQHDDAKAARAAAQRMREMVEANPNPPEGVPATGFLLLVAPDSATTLEIGLFETSDDLRTGHRTLNAMSPPPDMPTGQRIGVELCEVAVDVRAPARSAAQPR